MLNANWEGYRIVAWGGIAALVAGIAMVLLQGKWFAALTLGGFLIASVIFVARERQLPTLFDLVFVIAALINAAGWTWDLYHQPGPYDEIAHFFTSFALTLAIGFLLYDEVVRGFYHHRVMFVVVIASMGITVGVLWEIGEWLADFVVADQIIPGLHDTMLDLILDSAGALLAALVNLRGLHERARQ